MVCIKLSELPCSANAMYRAVGKRVIKSEKYRAWQKNAGKELMAQRPKKIIGPVSLAYRFGTSRKDLGNLEKATTDLLVLHGVIEDDGPKFVRSVSLAWSPDVKGVEIVVRAA